VSNVTGAALVLVGVTLSVVYWVRRHLRECPPAVPVVVTCERKTWSGECICRKCPPLPSEGDQ
jgi:hypothetical protein